MTPPFAFCAAYAFALAALILSHLASWAALDLFLVQPHALGTHTTAWMNWHAVGCAFVGLVNLLAGRWREAGPRRAIAGATAAIFGAWCLQNLALMFGRRFTALMWLNVVGCAVAAAWSLAYAARAPTATSPRP